MTHNKNHILKMKKPSYTTQFFGLDHPSLPSGSHCTPKPFNWPLLPATQTSTASSSPIANNGVEKENKSNPRMPPAMRQKMGHTTAKHTQSVPPAARDLNRNTSHRGVVEVPQRPEYTDACPTNWPHTNPGRFRIDDPQENAACTQAERNRREKCMRTMMRTLGKGLVGAQEAAQRSQPLRHPRREGKKRQSHTSLVLTDMDRYQLRRLPEGYAVYQSCRQINGGVKASEHSKVYDSYICGSSTVREFRSTKEFIPHLYWLSLGCPRDTPCECYGCGHPTSPRRNTSPTTTRESSRK
ncbi:hypothetical protein DL93DRAFT_2079851 [Clavulina sp. PMI_390]|nr:hypothetical protein DL93DRAFT_2079851 [Clavulina sp. PMI_390]